MTDEPDGPGEPLQVVPIGVLRTPFPDRASAPRQPAAAVGTRGRIELSRDGRFEHALLDLDSFKRIWVLFWFHLNEGWKAKVRPPRSAERRGVFATRSPYRPNPIGMSVLRLERIEGRTLHVLDVDMVDGTPVLDIKPYLPYTDAFPDAEHGWLDAQETTATDPGPRYEVRFSEVALLELAHVRDHGGMDLEPRIVDVLGSGPSPHPYRRIKKHAGGYRLAVKEYRVDFQVVDRIVTVEAIVSGYRARDLAPGGAAPEAHRRYVEAFGVDGRGRTR